MKRCISQALIGIIGSLSMVSCSLHPIDPHPEPTVVGSANYTVQSTESPSVKASNWWHAFGRTELESLIELAFKNNFSIAQARYRLTALQAVARQTRSGLFPSLDLSGNGDNAWLGSDETGWESSIGSAFSWEIDLFQRIASAAMSAKLEAEASSATLEAVQLALSAEIARAYFGAVASQKKIDLLNDQLATDRKLLELIELRLENGVGTNVEVLQQQSRVADSQTLIPKAEIDLRIFENQLDVLLGAMPDGIERVAKHETLDFSTKLPPLGVPADLLMERPDLRAARKLLVAADSAIAEAIADRLPRFTLQGSYAYAEASAYSGPLAAIVSGFAQPLLDWGRRKYVVEESKAVYQERLAAFTQNYLEAVQSVENALYQENRQREFILRLQNRIEILRKTVEESEARYQQGIDTYLPALNALQELRDVERDLVDEELNLIRYRIALHRAVGGPIILP